MRQLTEHQINPFNTDYVSVAAIDDPDENAGNACHHYRVNVIDRSAKQAEEDAKQGMSAALVTKLDLKFQHGPVKEAGVNGITDQALLAIVLDRWRAFQKSKWANRETAVSITRLEEALMWQHKRTLDRVRRDVEGTNEL